jgi:hypothetical protein
VSLAAILLPLQVGRRPFSRRVSGQGRPKKSPGVSIKYRSLPISHASAIQNMGGKKNGPTVGAIRSVQKLADQRRLLVMVIVVVTSVDMFVSMHIAGSSDGWGDKRNRD